MPVLHAGRSPFIAILQWCRAFTGFRSSFDNCGDESVERMARDLGISPTELHQLDSRGPESADLLIERLAAMDLDRNEVARVEPAVFHDLQRVCTMCNCHRRCARDLARAPQDPAWKGYCPNAQTLATLSALPWASRQEW